MPDAHDGRSAPPMITARAGRFLHIHPAVVFAAMLTGLLLLTWGIYRAGLDGSFLFDDFVNLNMLGSTGPVHDGPSLLRYLTSGSADPTGRPLTLLSFLLDAQDWPADAFAFKRTNVLLHLLNGTLLCWVMLKLGERTGLAAWHNRAAAELGSAIWLLHPLFVSTTLYVVQREAMLPATFTMCGLLCWCTGRNRLDDMQIRSAWIWSVAGSLFCTVLATLCKANGALLPLLIVTAECTVLHRRSCAPKANAVNQLRRMRTWLLGVPVALLLVFLVAHLPAYIHSAAESRPWTVGQRLLSEPRILLSYLRLLWFPRSTSEGLFNDQTIASLDWLTPWTTLPCMLAVVALCILGWRLRKRNPIVAFAILFYFAGQLMESTFVPLELFFEHRNYLPAAFMFWPLAIWLTASQAIWLRPGLAALIVMIVAASTWSRVQVWGDLRQQALIWGRVHPDSPRAQAFAATVEMAYGHYPEAILRLRTASVRKPDEVQLTLNLFDAECATGMVTPATWQRVLFSLQQTTNGSQSVFDWFVMSINRVRSHSCGGLTLQDLQQALQAARVNPTFSRQPGRRQDFAHIAGLLALAQQQPREALEDFNRALMYAPDRATTLEQAAALGAAGYPALGLSHLAFAQGHTGDAKSGLGMPRLHDWVLSHQGYWEHETDTLHAALATDAATRAAAHTPPPG